LVLYEFDGSNCDGRLDQLILPESQAGAPKTGEALNVLLALSYDQRTLLEVDLEVGIGMDAVCDVAAFVV